MARKSLNFVNSLRNVFRRKHSKSIINQVEPQRVAKNFEHKEKQKRIRKGINKIYHGAKQKQNYYSGGGRKSAATSNAAIYYPPSRGKFKGYMRKAC